jgi:hypothetical protein
MSTKFKFKVGDCYAIEFDDHAIGMGVIKIAVVGWFVEEDAKSLRFSYWVPMVSDKETREANMECFCILKSTILKKKKIS